MRIRRRLALLPFRIPLTPHLHIAAPTFRRDKYSADPDGDGTALPAPAPIMVPAPVPAPPPVMPAGDDAVLGKMFVGGISWASTEETLRAYFEQFGDVDEVILMKDKVTNQPRGFAFVHFVSPSSCDKVQQAAPHMIDGKAVDVKKAVPRGAQGQGPGRPSGGGDASSAGAVNTKVFVGGLGQDVMDLEFRQYFEQFGAVTDAVVMIDRTTQRSRGFGFITFADEISMQAVLNQPHTIGGKTVEVKEAAPRGDVAGTIRPTRDTGGMGGMGGGGGEKSSTAAARFWWFWVRGRQF